VSTSSNDSNVRFILEKLAMRIIVGAIVTTLALGVVLYAAFSRESGLPARAAADMPKPPGIEPARPSLQNDSSAAWRQRRRDAERSEQQARLLEKLADVETRLAQVEAASAASTEHAHKFDDDTKKIAEADLGQWMTSRLAEEEQNPEWTKGVVAQIEQQRARIPGVQLESATCGDRFCRAKFFREDGDRPKLQPLFGGFPGTRGGFTVYADDGTVELYLVRQGQTVDGLRNEALAAAPQ
jgi:hypothetical protein